MEKVVPESDMSQPTEPRSKSGFTKRFVPPETPKNTSSRYMMEAAGASSSKLIFSRVFVPVATVVEK